MWSSEGKMMGAGNIYENHTAQSLLVTGLVHNDETEDKDVVISVPSNVSSTPIKIRAGESMAFTCIIEAGRAISSARESGKFRFSIFLHGNSGYK